MVKGYKTLSINESVFNRIELKYNKSNTSKSLTSWVSEQLLLNLEKEDFLTNFYAPYLNFIGTNDNQIFLKDSRLNHIIEITFQDEYLSCSENECTCCTDKDKNCIHISYVLSLPELSGFLTKHRYLTKIKKTRL